MMSGIQHFIQTVQRMQWSDYLDILVVAFLIYSLLPLFVKTPNVLKIAKTVGSLVLLAWLTGEMKLYTINWMLSRLLTAGLLAFVVLFQPELRNVLNHLGGLKIGRLFGFIRSEQEMEAIIDQTVMACKLMSDSEKLKTEEDKYKINAVIIVPNKPLADTVFDGTHAEDDLLRIHSHEAFFQDGVVKLHQGKIVPVDKNREAEKVGALIVFSRDNQLDEYFKNGTIINGLVTEQLLRNIFVNKAPLHDGAVIIQGGKIAAAGCVLPVSNNPSLPKHLGTRHRAAVGISEVSDAVAVVVSEESGGISVAIGGMLKPMTDTRNLEALLRNELCPSEDGNKNWLEQLVEWFTNRSKEVRK